MGVVIIFAEVFVFVLLDWNLLLISLLFCWSRLLLLGLILGINYKDEDVIVLVAIAITPT